MKNFLITGILFALLAGCSNGKSDSTGASVSGSKIVLSEKQLNEAALSIASCDTHSFVRTYRMNGSIDVPPQNMVSISFPFGGYLQSTDLLPGMHVRKGQVLAHLQDASYVQIQQDFLMAKIKLEQAEKEYNRQQSLAAQQATSEKALLQSRTDYHSLLVEVRALSEKLLLMGIDPQHFTEDKLTRTLSIVSPINGFVSHVNVNIGKYVTPTEVLFELVNPDDIHLALTAFEKDLPLLHEGQRVVCSTLEKPNNTYEAEIILISRNIDRDRTASVHCHFEKYDPQLLPGMFMVADVIDNTGFLPSLPAEAVVSYEGKNYVFSTVDGKSFNMIEVLVVAADKTHASVKTVSGKALTADRYVTRNAYSLVMAIKNESAEE